MKPRRALDRDDSGVNEVIGFILAFAVSSLVLVATMQAYGHARERSEAMLARAELQAISDRVATKIVQFGIFAAQDNQNATLQTTLRVPPEVGNMPYSVAITQHPSGSYNVTATSEATSGSKVTSILNIGNPKIALTIQGTADSSDEKILVSYRPSGATAGLIEISSG